MARLCRIGFQILARNIPSVTNFAVPKVTPLTNVITRPISVSPVKLIKLLEEKKEGDELLVEGKYVESQREHLLVRPPEKIVDGKSVCYMCALDLDLKFTDVLILSQFLRSDGCMMPRRVTGLCKMQQKRVTKLVAMAQKAGLMLNINPENCNRDMSRRWKWKKFNTYFDEKTIFRRRKPRIWDKFKRR